MQRTLRPTTPDSPLHRATNTIDDLTFALANFSRGSSPEPPHVAVCCCGREDCATSKSWLAYKTKLESRLVLSAEVGQALLERHEAYVRRHESSDRLLSLVDASDASEGHVDARVAELVKENAVLEKRLTQALVNNEVAEVSNKTTLQELEEARANVTRLTTQHARSVGWENRLAMALQEKDDMQQERDSAAQRAKLAEARISALKEKCTKLQAQLVRLREDVDMQRSHRSAMSQEVQRDARQRLVQLQQSKDHPVMEDSEVMDMLESIVMGNEALKRDNAELQNLLGESREELRALQEEVEERRANDTSFTLHRHTNSGQSFATSPLSQTYQIGTAPSSSALHPMHPALRGGRRAASVERVPQRAFEPLTPPETERRPLSPTDSDMPSTSKWNSFARANYPPSHHSLDNDDIPSAPPERPRAQKSLYLLTRTRGVQTDGTREKPPSPFRPTFTGQTSSLPSSSPADGRSESSSLTDSNQASTVMSALLERVATLLARVSQADALTLTNRLKRQHLLGADVSHLSRSTVSAILNEAAALRAHFRAFLEDEKVTTTCTRRDLRALLKLVKDLFAEMGQMRVTLNDVILDPSVAGKVSEMAMHPAKASAAASGTDGSGNSSTSGWMAPISKLLGLPGAGQNANEAATRALSPPVRPSSRGRGRAPARIVPKREAALSASAMTVNVEFSGTAVGRSVTSTYSAHPERQDSISILSTQSLVSQPVVPQLTGTNLGVSRSVMDIFAGAPRVEDGVDPWIVVPTPQRGTAPIPVIRTSGINAAGALSGSTAGSTTLGRSVLRHAASRIGLSRLVDAVDLAEDHMETHEATQNTLLDRTLRRRGLSDSSIHTTFMNHAEEEIGPGAEETVAAQDRQSVLAAISKRMQNFRLGSIANAEVGPSVSRPETSVSTSRADALNPDREGAHTPTLLRAVTPLSISAGPAGLLQGLNLSSWAAAALDADQDPASPLFSGSPHEESYVHRTWNRERDF